MFRATDEAGKAALKVASVDILVPENGKEHYTYDYEMMERPTGANLVVRRGQPFHLLLKFNRKFDAAVDAVSLIFTVAGKWADKTCLPIFVELDVFQKSVFLLFFSFFVIFFVWWLKKDTRQPSPSNGTLIALPVLSDNSSPLPAGGWWARLVASGDSDIKVQVSFA